MIEFGKISLLLHLIDRSLRVGPYMAAVGKLGRELRH
jgi:hypothetical protein